MEISRVDIVKSDRRCTRDWASERRGICAWAGAVSLGGPQGFIRGAGVECPRNLNYYSEVLNSRIVSMVNLKTNMVDLRHIGSNI